MILEPQVNGSQNQTVVIVGAGQAAGQAVASLRNEGFEGKIVLIGSEPFLPYQRPPLSKAYLAGTLPLERLLVRPSAFYEQGRIETMLGVTVARLNLEAGSRSVETSDGKRIAFDYLVLATGGRVRQLSCDGASHPRLGYLRNIADVQKLQGFLQEGAELILIGGGYVGLEIAAGARKRGLKVTVLEAAPNLLARVASPEVGRFYRDLHQGHGVQVHCDSMVSLISGSVERPTVRLQNGSILTADFLIAGIGLIPNTELAAGAGIACDNGIVVDDHCRTSVDGVFAIGDCTQHPNGIYGIRVRLESVPNALEQGKTVAASICGKSRPYWQVPWFWSDQYDIKLQTAGLNIGYDTVALRGKPADRSFAAFYFRKGRLLAVDAVNRPAEFLLAKTWIAKDQKICLERLADDGISPAKLPVEASN